MKHKKGGRENISPNFKNNEKLDLDVKEVIKYRKPIYPDLKEFDGAESLEENIMYEKNKIDKEYNRFRVLLPLAILIFVIVLFISIYYVLVGDFRKLPEPFSYNELYHSIKKDFPSQTDISWKIINVTIFNHIFRKEAAVKPAVICMVGDEAQQQRLVGHLSTVLTRTGISGQCIMFPGMDYDEDIDDMKVFVQSFIANASRSHSRCIYVPHVDNINPSMGPYLHGLTDEITAPYKDLIFIFTIDTGRTFIRDSEAEDVLVKRLSVVWMDGMGEERFEALMSRVAVNVVVVP